MKILKSTTVKLKIVIVLVACIGVYASYNCVKPAIPMWQALIRKDNIRYFIIQREGYLGDGGEWCYLDGKEKKPVILLGRTPQSELSWDLSSTTVGNRFLVKGTLLTEYIEFTEKDVIMVENWEIIAPIHRIYGTEASDSRMLKPLLYLDRYDVERGNYYKIITNIRAISFLEEKLIWANSDFPCYYITADVANGKVQWYMVGDEAREYKIYNYLGMEMIPIGLEGVPLESHFGEIILRGFGNEFLVKGQFDRENGILEIVEWYITYPINRGGFYHNSQYYFTEEDILNGVYIP